MRSKLTSLAATIGFYAGKRGLRVIRGGGPRIDTV